MTPPFFKDFSSQLFYVQGKYTSRVEIKLRHFHEEKSRELLGIRLYLQEVLQEVFQGGSLEIRGNGNTECWQAWRQWESPALLVRLQKSAAALEKCPAVPTKLNVITT